MPEKPSLLYFEIRGRAEPVRMLLHFAGADYEDEQITQEQWENRRNDTPFRRMPVYREGPLEIPETFAILNYLGRKYDLLGNTELERVRCDVTVEAWRDYGNRLANAFGALATSAELRRQFAETDQPALLADLEAYYIARPRDSDYWAGKSATIGDFAAFHLIDAMRPAVIRNFPALLAFHHFFSGLPAIRGYLESPERPAALFYGPDGKVFPEETGRKPAG